MTVMSVSNILLWAAVLGLACVVLALARQIGLLHERLAPVGALATKQGPQTGESAPRMQGHLIGGGTMEIGAPLAEGALQLLLFVAPSCPICKKLIPIAQDVVRDEGAQLVFVGDEDPDEQRKMIAVHGLERLPFINGPEIGMAFAVAKLPHAVLLDDRGRVAARGLVNSREHLESLFVSHETGVTDLQTYLRANKPRSSRTAAN